MSLVIDDTPANVTLRYRRGDDGAPLSAWFEGVDFSTDSGFAWEASIVYGEVSIPLSVSATVDGDDTLVIVSGMTAEESEAVQDGATWELKVVEPTKKTYLVGRVVSG